MGCGCKKRQQEQPAVPTPATIQLPQELLTNENVSVQEPENNTEGETPTENQ